MKIKTINYQNSAFVITICLLIALFFTMAPFMGWSHYALEISLIQCGISWEDQSFNVISYNMVILIFEALVPLIIIFTCSIKLLNIVKKIF
jgi:hypothetical protein